MPVNDLNLLVPAFRERVDVHLQHLRDAGYKPRVHETHRGKVRAAWLVLRGKSRARGGLSMHCFGVAVDIICDDHLWSCADHGCGFYDAQDKAADAAGLVWGGDWDGDGDLKDQKFDDRPHLQGVPLGLQNTVRKMPRDQLEAWLAERLAWA